MVFKLFLSFVFGALSGTYFSVFLLHHHKIQRVNDLSAAEKKTIPEKRELFFSTGVAVTIIPKRIHSPTLGLAKIRTVASQLPKNWYVLSYIRENSAIDIHLLERLAVVKRLPIALEALSSQREILLAHDFWLQLPSPRVLWFEFGTTIACSSWPYTLNDFEAYDWIGAKWKWARPDSPHLFGGNGAFSLRNRNAMLAALKDWKPPTRGNEDTILVRTLFEDDKNRISTTLGRKPKLAPGNVSESFAVEEVFDSFRTIPPFGVYHLMRTMPAKNRTALIRACPEARLLFEPVHDPRCALRCPHNLTLIESPLRVWNQRCSSHQKFRTSPPLNNFSPSQQQEKEQGRECQLTRNPPPSMHVGG